MEINFDAVRRQHPIADIIGQAIKLTKQGREYKGCCPFHTEKTPSFHVVPDKDFAHCFGCGWHGDVVDFVAAYQRISLGEAVDMLTGGGEVRETTAEEKAQREAILAQREQAQRADRAKAVACATKQWDTAERADAHHPYLVRKQVEAHTCRQTSGGDLLLPIYDAQGEIQSVQTIADDGSKKFFAGAPTGLGRMMVGINMGRVILCEGYATGVSIFDAVLDQVCVTYSCENMEKVAREKAADGQVIILAADTGLSAEKMARLARELDCPLVVPRDDIPDNGTDFNDQAQAFGRDCVAQTFRAALKYYYDSRAAPDAPSPADVGPVDLWAKPAVPELPRGLLPPVIEEMAFAISRQMGTDPAGLAMAALAVCGAAIPDSVRLQPKLHEKEWQESARLWVMLVGDPSSKKSPIYKYATKPVKQIDKQLREENRRALLQWQKDKQDGIDEPKPPCPRLYVSDATQEAVQRICADSPEGVMLLRDELKGMFAGIGKYTAGKGGGDSSFWLESYNGGAYMGDRVGSGNTAVENLSLSMLGSIQPEVVRGIFSGAEDNGLLQRFIPIILRDSGDEEDEPLPPVYEAYCHTVEALRSIKPPSSFFGTKPLQYCEEGLVLRRDLVRRQQQASRTMAGFNNMLSSHIRKHEGLFVRLCVIWHCLENMTANGLPETVPIRTVRRVEQFLSGFIMGQSVAFYTGVLGMTDKFECVTDVAGHILAQKLDHITLRDLAKNVRSTKALDKESKIAVMERLEMSGWVYRDDKRKDSARWVVEQGVHEMFASRAGEERERRLEIHQIMREMGAG